MHLLCIRAHVELEENFPSIICAFVFILFTDENFGLIYDSKRRSALHRISPEEAQVCR